MNPMTSLLQTSLQDSNSTPPLNPLLCDQCQLWDDLERFEPARGSDRSLEERMKAQGCIMCDATVSLVNSRISKFESAEIRSWPPSRVSIRDQGPFFLDTGAYVEGIPAHRIDKSDPADQIIRLLVSLEVNFLPENEQNPTVKHERLALTPQFCLHYSGEPNSHLKSIEPWNVPYFDAPLLQKWIRGCEQAHKGLCDEGEDVKSNNLPRGFRVIDLREMKIVEPLDKVRFAALSYMWPTGKDNGAQLEKSNLKDFEAPGGVAKVSLPKLVTDAIALCKDLGEDFLWVDRICIVQDDATSKHSQIQGMDKIYQSASFCLVAALNARDGQGLPGFKNQPRMSASDFPPRECEIEGRGIKANGRETMVDTSLWNNRGWTFQERVLSRRCLFITDFQVIFECSRGQAFEELTYYPQQPLPAESNNEGLSPEFIEERKQERILEEKEHHLMPFFSKRPTYGGGINYNMNKSSTLVTYFEWVEDYTSRQLSFGSDILNAFAGVGNALADSLSSQMIFGLPEKYLPQALMWSTFGSATGRTETPDIPSWSWASCSNPIDYYWLKGFSTFKDDLLTIATIVEYFYQDPETGLRRLNVGERWIQHEIPLIEAVNGAQLPRLTGKYIPGDWRTHETWIQCPHSPFHTLACPDLNPDACNTAKTLPRSLVFNTTIASLRIGHHFKYTRQGQSPDIQDAAIFDPNGQHVGQIHGLPLDWINAQVASGRTHEFIVLCGALANWRERKTMAQYFGDFDMWRLHVMLVERSNSHSQAVRRVEVGYVFAHKWKDCNPQWDTVVLV